MVKIRNLFVDGYEMLEIIPEQLSLNSTTFADRDELKYFMSGI